MPPPDETSDSTDSTHSTTSTKEIVNHIYPPNDDLQRKSYRGEWENGKRNGKGTLEWKNGAVYAGHWENDVLSGIGSFLLPVGFRYEGEFQDNQFHGHGVLSWVRGGRRYEGAWKAGKHDGFGVLYFATEDSRLRCSYRGEWANGKREGYGTMIWRTGARYDGAWHDGKREGQGKQLFANGDTHVGWWQQAKRHGPGCRVLANGDQLVGVWKDDARHGLFEYRHAHGRVEEVLYINGVLQTKEPLPQQVPSLKVLCIEAIGKSKQLSREASLVLPEDLDTSIQKYRNEVNPGLRSFFSRFLDLPR